MSRNQLLPACILALCRHVFMLRVCLGTIFGLSWRPCKKGISGMYYLSESNERAILLPHLPQPAGGPPLMVSSDIELRFAYPIVADFFQQDQPDWFAVTEPADAFVEVVSAESFLSQGETSE